MANNEKEISSILISVRKAVGPSEDYTYFDPELIMHINSVFADLQQLGMGPSEGFEITDDKDEWDDFYTDPRLNVVRSYMYIRVRLLFDPPSNSFVVDSLQKQADKIEWRLTVAMDDINSEA